MKDIAIVTRKMNMVPENVHTNLKWPFGNVKSETFQQKVWTKPAISRGIGWRGVSVNIWTLEEYGFFMEHMFHGTYFYFLFLFSWNIFIQNKTSLSYIKWLGFLSRELWFLNIVLFQRISTPLPQNNFVLNSPILLKFKFSFIVSFKKKLKKKPSPSEFSITFLELAYHATVKVLFSRFPK